MPTAKKPEQTAKPTQEAKKPFSYIKPNEVDVEAVIAERLDPADTKGLNLDDLEVLLSDLNKQVARTESKTSMKETHERLAQLQNRLKVAERELVAGTAQEGEMNYRTVPALEAIRHADHKNWQEEAELSDEDKLRKIQEDIRHHDGNAQEEVISDEEWAKKLLEGKELSEGIAAALGEMRAQMPTAEVDLSGLAKREDDK